MSPVELAVAAKAAALGLQRSSTVARAAALERMATALIERQDEILAENERDLAVAGDLEPALRSRLKLSPAKLATLAEGIRAIAAAEEPLGRVLRATELAEGLELQQVTAPIGVLLVIFESRPDVLPQVAALAVKSGNGLLLKGGSEALHSNRCLHRIVTEALDLGPVIGLVETRADIADLLALDDVIDLVIPRGSKALVRHIQQNTRIPVLGHADGVCHVYVDDAADLGSALEVVLDAKCDYPAACNAMETLLLHEALDPSPFVEALEAAGVVVHRQPADWHTEYGSLECSLAIVSGIDEAIDHIHAHGSGHTEAILTADPIAAQRFLDGVDSACVFHNASTRFADGYRFGLGAEVGISTARIHARGPVGLDGLLTTRWKLRGQGDTASAFSRGERVFTHRALDRSSQVLGAHRREGD
ncbi:MAG TPA: glutamate-5-semialdehyde dehydrogenase [Myxococcota bacterium]|nr:glutamate-5-semialdehyde dehydrogenase [Myxococcota bacterium]